MLALQCLNNIGVKNLLSKIRGNYDLFSIIALAKSILLPGRGTIDKDYDVCGSQNVFELSNALAGAPSDCLDDALSSEIKLNVAKYRGATGGVFHSTVKSYSLKDVAACSLQAVAFGVPLGCSADVTNCYTNANLIFAPEKGCRVNGSSSPTSSTCQAGFSRLNTKNGELGCCVQTVRYPANRGPFSLNQLVSPKCATMFLPWARASFNQVNSSFGKYGLEVDRVIDWLCTVPGCYTPTFTTFVNEALKGATPQVTERCVSDPLQAASGYATSSAFSVQQATEVPLILSMTGAVPVVPHPCPPSPQLEFLSHSLPGRYRCIRQLHQCLCGRCSRRAEHLGVKRRNSFFQFGFIRHKEFNLFLQAQVPSGPFSLGASCIFLITAVDFTAAFTHALGSKRLRTGNLPCASRKLRVVLLTPRLRLPC